MQVLIDQMGLDCVNCYWGWNWQVIFSDILVGEYQQYGVVMYYFFGFVVQFFDCCFECGFSDVKGDIQCICVVVFFFYCCELFEIGVEQNW